MIFYQAAGTIDDLQDRDDLQLVTDSQEVEAVLQTLGWPSPLDEDPPNIGGLLVSVEDGDFGEIYGFIGNIPYLSTRIFRIKCTVYT